MAQPLLVHQQPKQKPEAPVAARLQLPPLLLLLLALAACTAPLCHARSESEARSECFARCLSDFKSQISAVLLATLRLEPHRINPECNAKPELIENPQDRNATRQCQQCTHACNNFATTAYESEKTCDAFCQRVYSPPAAASSSTDDNGGDEDKAGGRGTPAYASTTAVCQASCRTLRDLLATNQGDCPTGEVAEASAGCDSLLRCRPETERSTCYGSAPIMKCCLTACGYACVAANNSELLLPDTPAPPTVAWLAQQDSVRAAWDAYNLAAFPQPIVFLIQFRSYKGHRFSAAEMATSSWRSLAVTTTTNLLIQEPLIGHWYQFRLAAVSTRGHRAYSNASEPVKPAREPRRPGPVLDLQEGLSRIQGAARVDVQIRWKPPASSDLPIAKYEIKWAETLGFTDQVSLTNFETRVPGTQTECTLPNLKLGTTYQVSVWAIAYYGSNLQLISRKASLFVATMQLTTQPPPNIHASKPHHQQEPPAVPEAERQCSCQERPQTPVKMRRPFWESGDIRLLIMWPTSAFGPNGKSIYMSSHIVKWTQRVCIESRAAEPTTREAVVHNDPTYTLTDLRFNCHYSLQVKGLTETGDVAVVWDTCFCTASCRQTEVRGSTMPQCPASEVVAQPQPPRSVQVDVLRWGAFDPAEGAHYAARITWKAPAPPMADTVRAYRITWGPREFEDVSPVAYAAGGLEPRLDAGLSDARVLDRNRRELLLPNLRPGLLYIVRLQAITDFGDSRAHQARFATPEAVGDQQASNTMQKYIHLTASPVGVSQWTLVLPCLCVLVLTVYQSAA